MQFLIIFYLFISASLAKIEGVAKASGDGPAAIAEARVGISGEGICTHPVHFCRESVRKYAGCCMNKTSACG